MKSIQTVLLVNAKSRQSKALFRAVIKECEAQGIDLTEKKLVKSRDMTAEIAALKRNPPERLIIGGGDGTVSRVAGVLSGTETELAIVPLGTTNNFARSLNLPLEVREAVKLIQKGKTKMIDLGRINDVHFANVVGIGLSAEVAKRIEHKAKRRFGRLAYGPEGLKQLIVSRPFQATIQDPQQDLKIYLETWQIIVANGRFHAGKEIAADASMTSRELIVFALGGRSRRSFILAMLDFYLGRRRSIRHKSYFTGRHVAISTSRPRQIEVDGEALFTTPTEIRVEPAAVKVIVG